MVQNDNQDHRTLFDRVEIYLHMMILLFAIVVFAMSFTMTLVGETQVYLPGFALPLPETCSARIMFGIDCPACGLTRAFISISQGEFAAAWHFNYASYLVYAFVVVQIPWQSYQIWRIWSGKRSVDALWLYYLPIVMTIALVVQWLVRLL